MIPILSDRHGSFRCSTKNIFFFLLLALVAFVSGQELYSQEDLEAMTEAELEDICVTRGFKLVNDNAEELTKQDYVEAAQRCLAIEQEMNELLTQYPELADELEEEIKKMEDENKQKQADLERLQNEMSHGSKTDETPEPGAAFVRSGTGRVDETSESPPVEPDEVVADDNIQSSTIMDLDDNTEYEEEIEDEDVSSSVETIESPKTEDLTLTHLAVESIRVLVKNAQDDVRRIINLAIPVLQPLLNVGDVAWRQMKDLFSKARKAYEAYQATSTPPDETAETLETCDDNVYS